MGGEKQPRPKKTSKKNAQLSVINHAKIIAGVLPKNSIIKAGLLR